MGVSSNLCSGSLTAFVDCGWVKDTQDCTSVSDFIIFFGTSPKKQKFVTLAEFVALCDESKEILWLQPLEDFQIQNVRKNIIILEDNIPAINLAQNEQKQAEQSMF